MNSDGGAFYIKKFQKSRNKQEEKQPKEIRK